MAHALGAMTIQAAGARRLAATDADRARMAFQAVETTGREARTELRTLMEVLRQGPAEPAALEPQPGLGELTALADRSRALGLGVELAIAGTAPTGLARVLMKLRRRDRVQAVVLAYESGISQPGRGS